MIGKMYEKHLLYYSRHGRIISVSTYRLGREIDVLALLCMVPRLKPKLLSRPSRGYFIHTNFPDIISITPQPCYKKTNCCVLLCILVTNSPNKSYLSKILLYIWLNRNNFQSFCVMFFFLFPCREWFYFARVFAWERVVFYHRLANGAIN